MATANNAQHEPSMEEILASIRKIIEDSDTTQKGAEGLDGRDQGRGELPARNPVSDMDVFRAELRGGLDDDSHLGGSKPALAQDPPKDRPLTATSSRPPYNNVPLAATAAGAQAPSDKQVLSTKREATELSKSQSSTTFQKPAVAIHGGPSFGDAAAKPEEKPTFAAFEKKPDAKSAALAVPAFQRNFPPSSSDSDSDATAGQKLVSEQTSRQVAASFGELSEVLASRGRKGLDEMAEEMLRPMLQDWLDNNLPTLVERLVREEIERVARGG